VFRIAKSVYAACKDGPGEYRGIAREAKSLQITLKNLSEDSKDPNSLLSRKGTRRKNDFLLILTNCEKVMKELQHLVDKHSSLNYDGHGVVRRI
jgi:hypothetical protein